MKKPGKQTESTLYAALTNMSTRLERLQNEVDHVKDRVLRLEKKPLEKERAHAEEREALKNQISLAIGDIWTGSNEPIALGYVSRSYAKRAKRFGGFDTLLHELAAELRIVILRTYLNVVLLFPYAAYQTLNPSLVETYRRRDLGPARIRELDALSASESVYAAKENV